MGELCKYGFTGGFEDAKYRTAGENLEGFKKDYSAEALQGLIAANSVCKGAAQSLLKRVGDDADVPPGEVVDEQSGVAKDQATRQMALLETEVEADNKKWRQLIGRDSLTGLSNSEVNLEHGWPMGDRILKASAKGLQNISTGRGRVVPHRWVQLCSGCMDGNSARQRAAEIRRSLETSTVRVDETTLPLASSLGVVTVTQNSGNSETEMAAAVFQAPISTLYKAKEEGGNTAEIYNSARL